MFIYVFIYLAVRLAHSTNGYIYLFIYLLSCAFSRKEDIGC